MFSGFIHGEAYISTLFFFYFLIILHCDDILHFCSSTHQLMDECPHFLAIMNNAAWNICIHVSLYLDRVTTFYDLF